MLHRLFHFHRIGLGLAYFTAASLTVSLTRYDGGVAFLWVASPLLIADLMTRPRRHWKYSLLPCALASGIATGVFGLGWMAALPFVAINMLEAGLAAWLFRRRGQSFRLLGSLSWLGHFVTMVGIAAPLLCATLAAATLWALGKPPGPGFVNYFVAHALGNITLTPLAIMVARGGLAKIFRAGRRRATVESAILLLLVGVTSTAVFVQSGMPLLFLPILPIILVTFRVGRGGAAIAIVVLALIGGGATMAGMGPIYLHDAAFSTNVQLFQFYLAATVLTVLPVAADLHNRSRLHRQLRMSEARYRLLADHSTDILLHLEVDGRIRFVSRSMRQLGGHDPDALIGRSSSILVAPEHRERVYAAHLGTAAAGGEMRSFEYLALTADGTRRWFETHAKAVLDENGEVDGLVCVARDISTRKAIEQRLAADALTDSLTGLPNRRGFRDEIERRPAAAPADRTDCIALLDIDHFKVVNDSFGHVAGDAVLRGFARVARLMVRECDLVARVGGEEFAILFPDTTISQAMLICDRLRVEMARTDFRAGRSTIMITVSGGVAVIGPEGLDHAINVADQALYQAKRNGRDQFALAA